MVRDNIRLIIILFAGLIAGLLIGHVAATLFVVSFGYILWQHHQLGNLLAWMQNKKNSRLPEMPGIYEDLSLEVDKLKSRHKKRKKKLSSYLQQFHQATTALPDATVVLDQDHRIQWANSAAEKFLNIHWPRDQGQRITNLVRSPDLENYINMEPGEIQNTLDITSPINKEIFLSLHIVPYGKNQRLFVARDVTRLQRLIEIRKDFVANVSHELRTPLTVVRGYTETMQRDRSHCPESWLPILATMNDETTRMEAVIDDLLILSRLEEGGTSKQHETLMIAEMIGRIHKQAVVLSGDKRHLFQISAEPDLWLQGSSLELHSAFSNLVFNAVRYTPSAGVIGIRWYESEQDGTTTAHFEVSDNGIGIPPQHINRLTERFYRVEQSRSREQGGSGLGLSIVKHVLSRHNATLHIESNVDKGSTFRCDFPEEMIIKDTLGREGEVHMGRNPA